LDQPFLLPYLRLLLPPDPVPVAVAAVRPAAAAVAAEEEDGSLSHVPIPDTVGSIRGCLACGNPVDSSACVHPNVA
jgi:hypothetical protein